MNTITTKRLGRSLMVNVGRYACALSFRRPFFTTVWVTGSHFRALVLFGKPCDVRRFGFVSYLSTERNAATDDANARIHGGAR